MSRELLADLHSVYNAAKGGTLEGKHYRDEDGVVAMARTMARKLLATPEVTNDPLGGLLGEMADFREKFIDGSLDDSEWPHWDEAAEEAKRILEQVSE